MTRFSRKTEDEVPQRHDDQGPRRTRPADRGCPSVKAFNRIYNEGRDRPNMKASKVPQRNQDPIDAHGPGYDNDVPLTGDRAWLRGGGIGHRPNLDHGKYDISNAPPKVPSGLKATGKDMTKSPFSAAHRTYGED
jgi:hypothetical protein